MLMRFDPFRDFDRFADQVTRSAANPMPIDAYRRGDEVYLHVDLPGVDPESIELTVERNSLTIAAQRSWDPGPDIQVLARERAHGAVTRQLLLGENLDLDRMQATYDRGVLTLVIPVAEAARPRRVPITSTGEAKSIAA